MAAREKYNRCRHNVVKDCIAPHEKACNDRTTVCLKAKKQFYLLRDIHFWATITRPGEKFSGQACGFSGAALGLGK
jgi:hypothetical protein